MLGSHMKPYNFLCTHRSGSIAARFIMSCKDDLAALTEGMSVSAESDVEVWDGRRFVARVKAGNAPLGPEDRFSL